MTTDLSKNHLNDFIEDQTRQLDLVASWETLCDVYRTLEFKDELGDVIRLEEFKWIIKEMNKFLTRMRNKLMSCVDSDAVEEVLKESFTPTGKVTVDSRKSLAYQKLRQIWITRMLMSIDQIPISEEGSEDGWTDGYAD